MSQVKRFRADHRHVVETEFDDAQFVSVADYDSLQQRLNVAEQRNADNLKLISGLVEYADNLLADVNNAWSYAGQPVSLRRTRMKTTPQLLICCQPR